MKVQMLVEFNTDDINKDGTVFKSAIPMTILAVAENINDKTERLNDTFGFFDEDSTVRILHESPD